MQRITINLPTCKGGLGFNMQCYMAQQFTGIFWCLWVLTFYSSLINPVGLAHSVLGILKQGRCCVFRIQAPLPLETQLRSCLCIPGLPYKFLMAPVILLFPAVRTQPPIWLPVGVSSSSLLLVWRFTTWRLMPRGLRDTHTHPAAVTSSPLADAVSVTSAVIRDDNGWGNCHEWQFSDASKLKLLEEWKWIPAFHVSL